MNFITENFSYKVTLKAGKQLLIEGHKGISSYAPQEVTVRVRGANLRVMGEELTLGEINGEELFIEGKIRSVEVVYNG